MEEREYMMHRGINVNETETNRYNLEEAIEEWPDIAPPVMMEDVEDMIHRDKDEN